MKLIPLRCPRCSHPLPARQQDRVVACTHCPAHVALEENGLREIQVRYAQPKHLPETGVVWMPYWVLRGTVTLGERSLQLSLWEATDQAQAMWAVPRTFYVPAAELPLARVQYHGYTLLMQQPTLTALASPPAGARMEPAVSNAEDATSLAEYLVLSVEVKRDDMLQRIAFEISFDQAALWAIPHGDYEPLLQIDPG